MKLKVVFFTFSFIFITACFSKNSTDPFSPDVEAQNAKKIEAELSSIETTIQIEANIQNMYIKAQHGIREDVHAEILQLQSSIPSQCELDREASFLSFYNDSACQGHMESMVSLNIAIQNRKLLDNSIAKHQEFIQSLEALKANIIGDILSHHQSDD